MLQEYTAYYQSPIGILEIRSTEDAVTRAMFVDKVSQNNEPLPNVLQQCIKEFEEYFNGSRREFTVPVKQPGTEFQQQIWAALLTIPFGKAVSYLDIAKQIKNEKSTRAVGNANSKNKIGIIVPCHRVIGKSGKLVGYEGGLHRKQWLLEHEGSRMNNVPTLF